MKKTKIIVWIIQGYDSKDEQGRLSDVVIFELIDSTYEKALERAKILCPKKFYRLSTVIEKHK